jgi:AcrR family transcriptional regulator
MVTRGRPRLQSLATRREALLDAAAAALARDITASIETIATAAGCTKPLVYEVFESRDALIDATVERETQFLRDEIDQARARGAEVGARERIRSRVTATFAYARGHAAGAQLLTRLALDGDPLGRGRFAAIRDDVRTTLEREIGELPAILVLGAIRAVALTLANRDAADDEQTIEAVTAFIAGGLTELLSTTPQRSPA